MSRSRIIRTISANTKLSQAEYESIQAQAAARGLSLGEWMRGRLLASERDELVLSEIIAARLIFVNALYGFGCTVPWTADDFKKLVNHADSVKAATAHSFLSGKEQNR